MVGEISRSPTSVPPLDVQAVRYPADLQSASGKDPKALLQGVLGGTALCVDGIKMCLPIWFPSCVFFPDRFVYGNRMDAAACWFANSAWVSMEREEKTIARGLRRRDRELLDGLIERFQYRLFRYLLFLTGSRETAEDLFQETWVRVLERGHQYDGKSKFETWLFAIARHLAIDLLRRKHPLRFEDLAGGSEDSQIQFQPSGESSVFDTLAQRQEGERLATALANLPASYREVLVLRFQEELALEEIAGVLEAPLSTVKSRLYRGLEAMRELLEGA
jgi:RNA polymerase sigma-70 factor (ECF subfamily)